MFDCFSMADRERLEALRSADAFARVILTHTETILRSRRFERVQPRGKNLLAWLVGMLLLGEADHIKESTVAVAVFDEPADFDSSESSRIRVAVADLRERLIQFLDVEGAHEALSISLPSGSYIPQLVELTPSIEIVALDNWSSCDKDGHVRDAFVEEFIVRLREGGIRASVGRTQDFGATRQRYLLHGSFVCSNEVLFINVSLSDPASPCSVFTDSYQDSRDAILKIARHVSDDVLASLNRSTLLA